MPSKKKSSQDFTCLREEIIQSKPKNKRIVHLTKNKTKSHWLSIGRYAVEEGYQIALNEVCCSEFARFLLGAKVPKIRANLDSKSAWQGFSKEIPGYLGLLKVGKKSYKKFTELQKTQLGEILFTSYFLAESDLHNGNWGLDAEGNVVRIDFDQTLEPVTWKDNFGTESNKPRGKIHGKHYQNLVGQYPNFRVSAEEAYPIKTSDLENFPNIIEGKSHFKPLNWPFFDRDERRYLKENFGLDPLKLSNDPSFLKGYFKAALKCLILDEQVLDGIFQDFENKHAEDIKIFLQQRRQDLARELCQTKKFQNYIAAYGVDSLYIEIKADLEQYNREVAYVHRPEKADKYQHRSVNPQAKIYFIHCELLKNMESELSRAVLERSSLAIAVEHEQQHDPYPSLENAESELAREFQVVRANIFEAVEQYQKIDAYLAQEIKIKVDLIESDLDSKSVAKLNNHARELAELTAKVKSPGLKAMLLRFTAAAFIIGSIIMAVATFGVATPLSALVASFGSGMMLGISGGMGAVGGVAVFVAERMVEQKKARSAKLINPLLKLKNILNKANLALSLPSENSVPSAITQRNGC